MSLIGEDHFPEVLVLCDEDGVAVDCQSKNFCVGDAGRILRHRLYLVAKTPKGAHDSKVYTLVREE